MTQEQYNDFKDYVNLKDDVDSHALLKELKHRVPSRVFRPGRNIVMCPICFHIFHYTGQNFCSNCGQALDWGK